MKQSIITGMSSTRHNNSHSSNLNSTERVFMLMMMILLVFIVHRCLLAGEQ